MIAVKKFNIFLGIIFADTTEMDTFSFGSKDSDFSANNDESNLILEILFFSSLESQIYKRTYMNLQDTISNLGGYIHVLISVGWFVMSLPLDFYFTKTLVNEIYSFQPLNENFHNGNSNMRDNEKSSTLEQHMTAIDLVSPQYMVNPGLGSKEACNNQLPNISIQEDINKNKEDINTKKENVIKEKVKDEKIPPKILDIDETTISFRSDGKKTKTIKNLKVITKKQTFSENFMRKLTFSRRTQDKFEQYRKNINKTFKLPINFITFLSLQVKKIFKLKKNKKQTLYHISAKSLKKEMDISIILKRLHDIEKLTNIIFNENQLALFNMIGNPMIYLKKSEEMEKSTDQSPQYSMGQNMSKSERMNAEKLKNLKKYYVEQEYKNNLSEIDRRLLEMTKHSIERFNDYFL